MGNKNIQKIFEQAYAEHTDGLFRFALYKVSDREQALDILQECYLRFWETLQQGEVNMPRAFLYRIIRNLIIDWYKKKKTVALPDFGESTVEGEVYLDMFPGALLDAQTSADARIALQKIEELEPIYREAVYLRLVEELTPREIAEIVGESSNVVSVRINRGLRQLKDKFKNQGDEK